MSWSQLADLVPDARSRLPWNTQTFVAYFLPVSVLYCITAVLVVLPGTLPLRLALLPITLWLGFRAFRSIDVVGSNPGYEYLGYIFGLQMMVTGMRVTEWTFRRKPLRRLPITEPLVSQANNHKIVSTNGEPSERNSSHAESSIIPGVLWDILDLLFNVRGLGWDWAQGWQFPPETRPTSSRITFLAHTLFSAVGHFVIFDVNLNIIRSFSPSTFGSPSGGTIFDPSLPPFSRYTRSTFISLLSGITIYTMVQIPYDISTIIGILIFQQHPARWPPIFDSPWRSTSLATLWSKRWHQNLRCIFIGIGVKPLSFFAGRPAGLMGAFLVSAVLHDWALWSMGKGTEFWSVGGFFLVMGVGCIMESLFTKSTGLKVNGWVGWLWTMCWMVGWGNILVDAYARKGLIASKFIPQEYMPSQLLLSYIYGPST